MPKLLFSKIRIYEFKDLIQTRKPLRRLDILLSRDQQKKDIQCILVKKNKNDFFETKDKAQDVGVPPQAMEKVLTDKKSFAAFRAFLQSEFSEENIEFWKACKEYRDTTPAADLSAKAAEIYLEYLHPLAQREINIDHHVREKIKRSIARPSRSCFDEAASQIYWLMERDSCPRFLKTEAYHSLRRKTRAFW